MGDQDIAAAWAYGKLWFKVPESIKLVIKGKRPLGLSAKDIVLNLLNRFGANELLGYSVELYGDSIDELTLDERITIASMGTEMGVITLLFTPNKEVLDYCSEKAGRPISLVRADPDAVYHKVFELNINEFVKRVSLPGAPHHTTPIGSLTKIRIDSAFIGSCTNGRYEDMAAVAKILSNNKVAPRVVLKIVPATDEIWQRCLSEGFIDIFKRAGALVSNAGCAGCAAGQVGQNGAGEVTISTGNRNFPGKQGKGEVYLASPEVVATSAIAGFITDQEGTPDLTDLDIIPERNEANAGHGAMPTVKIRIPLSEQPVEIEGRVWYIREDNIDTDMIFHNRYLAITDIKEMGQYTFDNLKGYQDFAKRAQKGDIVIVQKNFGSGSSRQQAVDCFISLGVQCIVAESFGSIYERNAINAAFPIITYSSLEGLEIEEGDRIRVNYESGLITSLKNGKNVQAEPFSEVQLDIFKRGGLF